MTVLSKEQVINIARIVNRHIKRWGRDSSGGEVSFGNVANLIDTLEDRDAKIEMLAKALHDAIGDIQWMSGAQVFTWRKVRMRLDGYSAAIALARKSTEPYG